MRIDDFHRIGINNHARNKETPLDREVQKTNQIIQKKDTLDVGISAKEMNDWFEEAKQIMYAVHNEPKKVNLDVTGKEIVAKVLEGMLRDGKRNGNV